MRPTERQSLHFDLAHLADVPYTFNVALTSVPLVRHTAQTLAAARETNPLLRLFPDERLSHYVDVDLPSDAIALMYVTREVCVHGRTFQAPVHLGIHIPQAGRDSACSMQRKQRGAIHPKLAFHGITMEQFVAAMGDEADPQFPPHIQSNQDAIEAATALLFHHPNLINLSTDSGGAIPACIVKLIGDAIGDAAYDLPLAIRSQGDAWLQTNPIPGSSTTSIMPNPEVQRRTTGTLQLALQTSQDDTFLVGQQWNYEYSMTASSYDANVGARETVIADLRALRATSNETWTAAVKSSTSGLSIDTDSVQYTPPPTGDQWEANGVWSINDTAAPLTAAIVQTLLAGNASVAITTPSNPQGLLTATLVPGTADPNTGQTPFTANFTGNRETRAARSR